MKNDEIVEKVMKTLVWDISLDFEDIDEAEEFWGMVSNKVREKVKEAIALARQDTAEAIFDEIDNVLVSAEKNMDWYLNAFEFEELRKKWCEVTTKK